MKRKFNNLFSMKKADDSAEILIYEDIGEGWYGGITAKQFTADLKALGDVSTINVRVNSPGGDVFDGVAIYNQLLQHKATVNVFIDGLAASIASVIAMAGNTITIAENAMVMVHNPWSFAMGEAKDFRKMADTLDQIRGAILTTYTNKTGLSEADVIALLDAETWMDAKTAKEKGFATAISSASTSSDASAQARFDLSQFRNAPKFAPFVVTPAAASIEVDEPDFYRQRLKLRERMVAA